MTMKVLKEYKAERCSLCLTEYIRLEYIKNVDDLVVLE